MENVNSLSKQETVDEIHRLIGIPLEPLGPGSKERKSTLVAISAAIALGAGTAESKQEIAKQIVRKFGGNWDASCYSAGDTITNSGLTRF